MRSCYMSLGSTPTSENCASVGEDDYREQTRIEITAYIGQLSRLFTLPEGARFVSKANPHDFGTYHEVNIEYPSSWESGGDDEAEEDERIVKLYDIENETPEYWDDEAKQYLKENGYRHLK